VTYDDAGSDPERPARHNRQEGCLDRPPDSLPTRVEDLPDLPDSFDAVLDDHLDLLGIGLSNEARAGILEHVRFLMAWNAAINLTAIRDPLEIAVRHVVDSLVGAAVLRSEGVDRFVDLGSGGGFPAIPLALAVPADQLLLVESVAKKARFLHAVLAGTGLDRRGAVVTE
jgi:16S rRNA (guanine527-N7)-methyltransferase